MNKDRSLIRDLEINFDLDYGRGNAIAGEKFSRQFAANESSTVERNSDDEIV